MPLSWIYSKMIGVRNRLYDNQWFDAVDLGARTISVGNITTGGTGKTPLVAYIARALLQRGERVCVLTRGYGRTDPKRRVLVSDGNEILSHAKIAGDEPFELARKLNGKVVIIADADRISAGEWARRKFGVTTFVLDDGFQHRQVRRDLDIVCIDAMDPWGGGQVLPAGHMREGKEGLERADVIVITRSDLVSNVMELRSDISTLAARAAVFETKSQIIGVEPLAGKQPALADEIVERSAPVLAFCGIGNPHNFFELLRKAGYNIASTKAFRDHHNYSQTDIVELQRHANASGAVALLTTAKDAVKLTELYFELACYVVEIEIIVEDPLFDAII
jgi:tetraacyldisaccharide 4'-kinase